MCETSKWHIGLLKVVKIYLYAVRQYRLRVLSLSLCSKTGICITIGDYTLIICSTYVIKYLHACSSDWFLNWLVLLLLLGFSSHSYRVLLILYLSSLHIIVLALVGSLLTRVVHIFHLPIYILRTNAIRNSSHVRAHLEIGAFKTK